MGSHFRITTPQDAGLQRDPSTGRLVSGTTNEAPVISPVRVTTQAADQGVEVQEMIRRNPAPSGPPALPRAPMPMKAPPFKLG